jgi:tricorn protease
MKKRLALAALVCLGLAVLGTSLAAAPIKFARFPHICKGKIAFSYQGDIWVANDDGSNVRRLTDNIANEVNPRFSPDGRSIAFTSDRAGNNDVYVIPIEGGEPTQLTFMTVNDDVQYWTPDSQSIVFSTNRGDFAWGSPLYTVSKNGGLPTPMAMDQASFGMISQDGKMIAFNRNSARYGRKHYKGNSSADLFVQNLATKDIVQITDTDLKNFREFRQDVSPMWGADGMIYFASERDGTFNIWKISPRGGAAVPVTSHKKGGVQYPAMSPDGSEIVYECDFDLYKMKVAEAKPQKITLDLAFDPKKNLVTYLAADSRADGFSPSPKGDYAAVDYHGEIFVVPTEEGIGEMRQVTSSPWRERFESYSPNGKFLAYISDESPDEEIWLYSFDRGQRVKLTSLAAPKNAFAWSRDSKQIAFSADNKLFVSDVETGTQAELGQVPGGYAVAGFSPDGKWLVAGYRDDNANADLYLVNIAEKKFINVTKNPFRDLGGELTPDGKYLVFLSNRAEGVQHLFKVSLSRLAEDPDDPLVKERLKKEEEARGRDREKEGAGAAPALAIDPEGIERRANPITTGSNADGDFFLSKDGKTVYFLGSDERGPGLFSVGLDGKDRKKITDGTFGGLTPTEDRKFVFYRQQNAVYKMELAPNREKKKLVFNFKVTVDLRAEWEQIFEECWRVMKYRFYDPNMHGFAWDAIKRDYKPLLKFAGNYQDAYDIALAMIGEINASHTGVSGPDGPTTAERPTTVQTRYLGFELAPSGDFMRIAHIYRDGPADKEWIKLKTGDYVFSVNGHPLRAGDNYWKGLGNLLNEYAVVRVGPDPNPSGSAVRDVRIKTVASLAAIKYNEWVKTNRDYVDKVSNGQIAYVHIQSMNEPSLRIFENEVAQFANKKGIIVDIRYNGGGNIDQEVLNILARKPYEYWNSRWGARSWGRRPQQTIAGPKVMLINWRSASDSEVTPQGFRDLGLGRIVGNPTAAMVIATGSYALINGGSIRTPGSLVVTYDPAKPNNYGINLENFGVAPDVFVRNSPKDELDRFDRELDTAVKEALKMLKEGKWQYEKQ